MPAATVGVNRPGRRSRAGGFTLLELLVVCALIGVLAALAFGSMSSSSYAGTVEGFGDRIANSMETARLRAMSSRRWQRLEFNSTTVTVWQSETTGMGAVASWQLIETLSAPGKVTVASTDDSTHVAVATAVPAVGTNLPGSVDFAPDGSAQSFTVFLQGTDGIKNRVIVYRGTGASWVLKDW